VNSLKIGMCNRNRSRLESNPFKLRSKSLRYLLAVVAFLTTLPRLGWAPCVVFPEAGWNLWSVGQEAIYVVRPGSKAQYRVALIPRVMIRGNAPEFGVFVPTPSEPTLSAVGGTVFDEASLITQPLIRQRSIFGDGCGRSDVIYESPVATEPGRGEDEDVVVLQQKTVGVFDAVVLTAGSSSDLVAWLDEHGYRHGIEDARALDDYVAKRWVFTAMRLRRDVEPTDPFTWQTEPAMLLYETDSLTYPMRLAALSASPSDATRLRLTIVADKRTTFDGARTRYANRVSRKELERIRADAPVFGGLLSEGAFITKLTREYSLFDIKDDFDFRATEAREYQETTASYFYAVESLGALVLLGWCGRRAFRRKGRSA
jgi:hypothetical protein